MIDKKLSFSKYLFYGDYINQLSFITDVDLVTLDSDGIIVFPVEGHPDDVKRFNRYLNSDATRKQTIKDAFTLTNPGDSTLIFPLDFVMDNFLKNNTAFFKFTFISNEAMAAFLLLLPLLKDSLPPYVYLILKLNLIAPTEEYTNLNGEVVPIIFDIEGLQRFNADGSDENGAMWHSAPYYYNNVKTRLFELSLGLLPLENEILDSENVLSGGLLNSPTPGDSTAEFNKLLFLDFSP